MRTLLSRLPAALAVVATLTLGDLRDARADLPPPDGTKFVDFSFRVDNIDQFKDFALVAFPCGGHSAGAPIAQIAEITGTGPISTGPRGGNCKLYAMPRADLEAWHAAGSKDFDALVKGPRAKPCKGEPNLRFTLPTSDPRPFVSEVLHVAQLDATACTITSVTNASSAGTTSTPPDTSSPPQASAPRGGCAGCTTAPRGGSRDLGLAAAAIAVALASRGRRRRGSSTRGSSPSA